MIDKSNNQVHLRWLSLLDDFQKCRALSWGSAVLVLTYHSLCSVALAHRATTDIAECIPLLFLWMLYDDLALQDLRPLWLKDEAEWGIWMFVVLLVCFNVVEFHHVHRVKCQFGGK
ncbi:hypothetical protein Ahy_B05g079669 [Arachis hypogaea]|uniref:Aminotransferase-like plant mobile domain-containing protein n=1 Tax=Arachis hypogaea TaxID=3818 RepID=A0A444ZAJ8_ARAHY|nr:hypothetical protein Ahy_B05g079669 [Arachis hypogaea]